jgi:hypothetical protein
MVNSLVGNGNVTEKLFPVHPSFIHHASALTHSWLLLVWLWPSCVSGTNVMYLLLSDIVLSDTTQNATNFMNRKETTNKCFGSVKMTS